MGATNVLDLGNEENGVGLYDVFFLDLAYVHPSGAHLMY